jgi:hypothetical protein
VVVAHYRALESIKVHNHPTSDNTDRLHCDDGLRDHLDRGYYVVLSRILQVNFSEFTFHALR